MRKKYPDPAPNGAKFCANCGKPKPLDAFHADRKLRDGRQSWCKNCSRISTVEYQHTPKGLVKLAAYEQTEARKANRRAADQKRRAKSLEYSRRYRQTAMGKLVHGRQAARYRLKRATEPERVARLEALVASYDREIARLKQQRERADRAA